MVLVRVIVVDNASTDGSVEYLRERYPDVELLALPENRGYAGGANAGLQAGTGEYAIILNPDVALAPDHLEILAARLDGDPRIGATRSERFHSRGDDAACMSSAWAVRVRGTRQSRPRY
jgi:GT2 family glycosyltransferase